MPIATPSKAPLPRKPPKVRITRDVALLAQRTAAHTLALATYEAEMVVYNDGQAAREAAKKKNKRAKTSGPPAADESRMVIESSEVGASRSAAASAAAMIETAPALVGMAASLPVQQAGLLASAVGDAAAPSLRRLAAGVVPGRGPRQGVEHDSFFDENPDRLLKQEAWAEDVACYADQCGYATAPGCTRFEKGSQTNAYLEVNRAFQFERLDGHGQEPTSAERLKLAWPYSDWWEDRDRIVLLHEAILEDPPDGSRYNWEKTVLYHVCDLWDEGAEGTSCTGKMCWQ
jgi:hypothetical protein